VTASSSSLPLANNGVRRIRSPQCRLRHTVSLNREMGRGIPRSRDLCDSVNAMAGWSFSGSLHHGAVPTLEAVPRSR
jgi:hypothetical protein